MSIACAPTAERLVELRRQLTPELARQLTTSSELLRRNAGEREGAAERFPTGFPQLDDLLGGGLRRGGFLELVGRGSSGRFSLGLSVLASATQMGESAALIDLGDHLDTRAAEAQGIELARLLWLRPHALKQALAVAELVLGTGFPLVVVDVGLGGGKALSSRIAPTSWLRLARAARAHRGALLLLSDVPRSGTAADAVLELRAQPIWGRKALRQSLLTGLAADATLLRQRRAEAPAPRGAGTVSLLLTPYGLPDRRRVAGDLAEAISAVPQVPPYVLVKTPLVRSA